MVKYGALAYGADTLFKNLGRNISVTGDGNQVFGMRRRDRPRQAPVRRQSLEVRKGPDPLLDVAG